MVNAKNSDDGPFTMSWRRIATALAVLSVAATAALVVVASVKGAGTLATVALALAILAFAAELVIGLAQGQTTSQQMLRSEQINSDTRSLLADLRATTGGVLETVEAQYDLVLRHLLGEAIPEAVDETRKSGAPFDPAEFERSVISKFDALIREVQPTTPAAFRHGLGETGAHLLNLKPGDSVYHQRWGVGRIIEIVGAGTATEAVVRFDTVGEKRLLLRWAPIRRYYPERAESADVQNGSDEGTEH